MSFKFQKRIFPQRGVIVIMSSITLTLLLLLSFYFLNFTVAEFKISECQVDATQVYYLAEAGLNEAIWKLKNDSTWNSNFEEQPTCNDWSDSFSRSNTLFPNSSYEVQIQNSECARGQIISTAQLTLADGRIVKRGLKVKVFKTFGSLTQNSAIFSGGTGENISLQFSNINVHNGNFFSNNNLDIKYFSTLTVYDNPGTEEIVEGKVLAENNISTVASSIVSTATCSKNVCEGDCSEAGCPPASADMPGINFNLEETDSYYSRAQALQSTLECSVLCNGVECATDCIFESGDFEDLLWDIGEGGVLTLNNGITYVTGVIDLMGERRIIVNGILIADGTINIGEKNCWTRHGDKDCGYNGITVNDTGGVGKPSGILTQAKMNFGPYSSFQNIDITGLLYAYDEIKVVSMPQNFNITGGVLARKISFTSSWIPVNIYLDNTIIAEAVWGGSNPPLEAELPYSPVVTIEHWEETY
ncbi:MAG: hypothetical protein ABH967_00185 [Patescibacteria group bacterium]